MHTVESLEYWERSTEIPEEGCDNDKGDIGDISGIITGCGVEIYLCEMLLVVARPVGKRFL